MVKKIKARHITKLDGHHYQRDKVYLFFSLLVIDRVTNPHHAEMQNLTLSSEYYVEKTSNCWKMWSSNTILIR